MDANTQPENAVTPAPPEQPTDNKDTEGQGFKFGVIDDQPVAADNKDTEGHGFKFGVTDDQPVAEDGRDAEGHGRRYGG
jgi:hypothetical protein